MSIPAGSFTPAVLRQVAMGSLHASTRYDQRPGAVGVMCAPQRSVPSASSRIGVHGPLRPRGSRSTTLALTASWPSRKTVAVTRKVSPTTALAGRRPASIWGLTSRTEMRPITVSLSVVLRAEGLVAVLVPVLAVAVLVVLLLAARLRAGGSASAAADPGSAARRVAAVAVVRRVLVVRRSGAAVRPSSAPGCRAAVAG